MILHQVAVSPKLILLYCLDNVGSFRSSVCFGGGDDCPQKESKEE